MIDENLIKEYFRKHPESHLKVMFRNDKWEVWVSFEDPSHRGLTGYGGHHDLSSAIYLAFKDYEFFQNNETIDGELK